MFSCKHCGEKFIILDNIGEHACFSGKNVYFEDGNILYVCEEDEDNSSYSYTEGMDQISRLSTDESSQSNSQTSDKSSSQLISNKPVKTSAVWTRSAVLALFALYEANMDILDNPKLRGKIWQRISEGLLQYGIQMTSDQVRWKMNSLNQKYKDVIDNNSRSGRGRMDFQWFEEMESIFGKKNDTTVAKHIVSSQPTLQRQKTQKARRPLSEIQSTSRGISNEDSIELNDDSETSNLEADENTQYEKKNRVENKKRPQHGTGSKVAKSKAELEKQWLEHLKLKVERDKRRDEKYDILAEAKKESLKLKKQQLQLKEQELEQKREIAEKKMLEKRYLLNATLEVEKKKLKLLEKKLKNKENKNKSSDSDGN